MPQYPPAVRPSISSPLQAPISLQNSGNIILVGAPGGPVVFSTQGSYILPALTGKPLRTLINGKVPVLSGNRP